MKAFVLTQLLILVGVFVFIFLGVSYLMQVARGDLSKYLYSFAGCGRLNQDCCSNYWCDAGLDCVGGLCIEIYSQEIKIDERYLLYINSETNSRSQREEYFYGKTGLGYGECSNAVNCGNCQKEFNFNNALNCLDCGLCDSMTKKCKNCLSCESAESGRYVQLYECYDCSDCSNIAYDLGDSCSQCSSCNVANITTSYENGLSCNKCNQCNETSGKCYSCYGCDMPNEKFCETCEKTVASLATDCEIRHDNQLCNKVKECIANYEGEPCDLLEDTVSDMISIPWNATYPLYARILEVLTTRCLKEDLLQMLPENVEQKICTYDTSKIDILPNYYTSDPPTFTPQSNLVRMLTSSFSFNGITGENKGILFNDCGLKLITENTILPDSEYLYFNDPQIFDSSTTPRTPEGDIPINLRLVISNVSWNENKDNDCSFYLHLCAQEAIALSEEDPILNLYRALAYFEESKYNYSGKKWNFLITDPILYEVKVAGLRFKDKLIVDLKDSNADLNHISKAIIAGLRDYFIFNGIYNRTLSFFCSAVGMKLETCYMNNAIVVLNENVPWRLSDAIPTDVLSEIPNFKYIYYNSSLSYGGRISVEVSFSVYNSNIIELNNTIIVSPLIVIKPVPPNCGNGVLDSGEECDLTDDDACSDQCRADCTCPPASTCSCTSPWVSGGCGGSTSTLTCNSWQILFTRTCTPAGCDTEEYCSDADSCCDSACDSWTYEDCLAAPEAGCDCKSLGGGRWRNRNCPNGATICTERECYNEGCEAC